MRATTSAAAAVPSAGTRRVPARSAGPALRGLPSAPRRRGTTAPGATGGRGGPAESSGSFRGSRREDGKKEPPWALMGRSVHEHHVSLSKEQADELALLAVCDESGVDAETLRTALKRLEEICPPLAKRRARGEVKPAEMARLALDLPAVTSGMLGVKRLLPGADAAELCARQTSLFAKPGVDNAVDVVNTLRAGLEGAGLKPSACDELIAAVPAMLVIDAADGGTIAGIVARAGALRDALPTANLAKLCGKRPEFLVTKDRGEYRLTYESEPRVGHAAGMPVGKRRGDEKSAPGDGDGDGDGDRGRGPRWPESWYVYRSARQMRERMPSDCDVDRLLTDFPNILAMDVPALFEDLKRVFPGEAPADVLRRNPSISFQLERNTKSAEPLGPAANTVQADEVNQGLMTVKELRELAVRVRGKAGGEGE